MRPAKIVDANQWFPEVSLALAEARQARMVVDGEMCILDAAGRSDFDALHDRARRRRLSDGDVLVTFCAFDLLVFEGRNVMALPLLRRKTLLEDLLSPGLPNVLFARHVSASDVDNPVSWLYARALELELEGVVGKRADSIYRPGAFDRLYRRKKPPRGWPASRWLCGDVSQRLERLWILKTVGRSLRVSEWITFFDKTTVRMLIGSSGTVVSSQSTAPTTDLWVGPKCVLYAEKHVFPPNQLLALSRHVAR